VRGFTMVADEEEEEEEEFAALCAVLLPLVAVKPETLGGGAGRLGFIGFVGAFSGTGALRPGNESPCEVD
jgi:hypothetical protein